MQKTVHVNSYVRRDGTPVKEHYRVIDGAEVSNGIDGGVVYDEYPYDTWPHGDIPTKRLPDPTIPDDDSTDNSGDNSSGGLGDIFRDVVIIISEIAKIVAAISEAIASNNQNQVSTLETQLDKSMTNLDNLQKSSENSFKRNIEKLTKTKNKQDYANLYNTVQQQKAMNDKLKPAVARIKYSAEYGSAKDLQQELVNFRSDFDDVLKRTQQTRPLKHIENLDFKNLITQQNIITGLHPYEDKILLDLGVFAGSRVAQDASEFWKASSHDFNNSKKYINKNGYLVYSVKDLPKLLQPLIINKLRGQLNVDDTLGVIFNSNSSIANAVVNSNEIKQFFLQNKDALLKHQVIKGSIKFNSTQNLHNTYNYADVINAQISDVDASFNAIILDTWDFNPNENWTIQMARNAQEAGIIRNYYTLTLIRVPFDIWYQWIWLFYMSELNKE